MKQQLLLLILAFCPFSIFSQNVKGLLYDNETATPIVGSLVRTSEGQSTFTSSLGNFDFEVAKFPVTIYFDDPDYSADSLIVQQAAEVKIGLKPNKKKLDNVVVTASRRGQKLEDVPISMDVLPATMIANKGITTADQAVDQAPGVYSMDGQVSIRGGSGFSYGAGSRVMMLWNGLPLLSADAGDIKWNTIPIELASSIEVIKGASSVLYGSGALNGIIAINEVIPTETPYYRATIQTGFYTQPRRANLHFNKLKNQTMAEFATGQRVGKFFYNFGLNALSDDGYREGEIKRQARISGTFGYNSGKVRGLQVGLGYSVHFQHQGNFLIWQSADQAYTPLGGADIHDPNSTLSLQNGWRILVDPYVKYIGKKKVKQSLRGRFYSTINNSVSDDSQSATGNSYYLDYLVQKEFAKNFNVSGGASYIRTGVISALYGNHYSDNVAAYTQLDKTWGKFTITGGVRVEYFKQDHTPVDSYLYLKKDSTAKLPVFPIFRVAVTYKATKSTILRASFGQGVRYPATSERFVSVSVGALNIFPNPNLRREEGYAGEIGVKQIFKVGDNWKAILDVSGFINMYKNMTEFTFGVYNPKDVQLTAQNLAKWIGFRAENAERARILGAEITFASEGKIGDVTVRTLLGYTYMNPVSLNNDKDYLKAMSDTTGHLLKYRFNHLAKADVELEYKHVIFGVSARYNSYMKNIDKIFLVPVIGDIYILNGLADYRAKHHSGDVVFDARLGYEINDHFKVNFICNNVFNREYMGRPGDIRPPRQLILQLQMKF